MLAAGKWRPGHVGHENCAPSSDARDRIGHDAGRRCLRCFAPPRGVRARNRFRDLRWTRRGTRWSDVLHTDHIGARTALAPCKYCWRRPGGSLGRVRGHPGGGNMGACGAGRRCGRWRSGCIRRRPRDARLNAACHCNRAARADRGPGQDEGEIRSDRDAGAGSGGRTAPSRNRIDNVPPVRGAAGTPVSYAAPRRPRRPTPCSAGARTAQRGQSWAAAAPGWAWTPPPVRHGRAATRARTCEDVRTELSIYGIVTARRARK